MIALFVNENLKVYFISQSEETIGSLRRNKKIFGLVLFSTTLLVVWFAKQQKSRRLKHVLNECDFVNVDLSLFGTKVAFYR